MMTAWYTHIMDHYCVMINYNNHATVK